MSPKNRLLILFIALLLGNSLSYGQEQVSQSLLWEISGKNVKSPSYIFGTMHLIPKDDFLFPETLKEKVQASDILVMEIGGVSEQMKAMNFLMLDSGNVFNYFNKAQQDSLFTYIESELGYTEAQTRLMFGKMKPFVLLQMFTKEMFGENPESYELTLEQVAKEKKIQIIGLETIEEQIGFIDKLSIETQVEMLMSAINDGEDGQESTQKLIDTYLSQDIDSIYAFTLNSTLSSVDFEEGLLTNRNKNWIKPIQKTIKKNKSFIAVGAAHLGGTDGVIQLLRDKGYTLTPIKF